MLAPRVATWIAVGVVVLGIVGVLAVDWHRRQVPVGTEQRAELILGLLSGYVWIGEGDHYWCLAPNQGAPGATSQWDDGVHHAGTYSTGVIHFTSDVEATFVSDRDGPEHPFRLVRMTTNRYGCHFDDG